MKSLLRFPEVSTALRRPEVPDSAPAGPGPDAVTEYFVVGSLASWAAAFALGLLVAGQ